MLAYSSTEICCRADTTTRGDPLFHFMCCKHSHNFFLFIYPFYHYNTGSSHQPTTAMAWNNGVMRSRPAWPLPVAGMLMLLSWPFIVVVVVVVREKEQNHKKVSRTRSTLKYCHIPPVSLRRYSEVIRYLLDSLSLFKDQ